MTKLNRRISPRRRVLPGFGLSLGYTLTYLSLVVLIPLSMLFVRAAGGGWQQFWRAATAPDTLLSYRVTFGCSVAAACINVVFGFLVAWVLVRYSFPGKGFVDAAVDLPFALPTAVGGIALTSAYGPHGALGSALARGAAAFCHWPLGMWFNSTRLALVLRQRFDFDLAHLKVAYTPLGVVVALVFISLPFMVRTVQPVLQEIDVQVEEAAAALGADRWQTFRRVLLPYLYPAIFTGFSLSLARAIGEYGSVVFIAGSSPKTQIAPQIIFTALNSGTPDAVPSATSVALVLLLASFLLLFGVNGLQWLGMRRFGN